MNIYESQIHDIAQEVEAKIQVLDFLNALITDIRYRKVHGDSDVKPLEFLLDASEEDRVKWMKKALITAEHHDIFGNPSCAVEFFLKCKKQMKEDREVGVKLW